MGQVFVKIVEIRFIYLLKNLIILQMIEECMYFGEVYFIIQNIDRCINFKCFKFFDKKVVVGYSCFRIFFWLFNVKIIF